MKVLVSGAGGFIGQHLVEQLTERGHHVRAIIRGRPIKPKWDNRIEVFHGDLEAADLAPAFDNIDATIHLAAVTRGNECSQVTPTLVATDRFLRAMACSSVRRLIHVSSLAVYDWTKADRLLDENSPLLNDGCGMDGYTRAKVGQENLVTMIAQKHMWQLTIVRPGFVWGPGHPEVAGMGRRWGPFNVMFGPFTQLPLTHVKNCVDCIIATLECPAAIGEIFNVLDGHDVRVWQYVREYVKRSRQFALPVPVPYWLGLAIARLADLAVSRMTRLQIRLPSLLTPRRFQAQFKPLRFSNKRLQDRLGWKPPMDFNACLAMTYRCASPSSLDANT